MISSPVAALLKSRKFIVAVAFAVAYVLGLLVPGLAQYHSEIAGVFVVLAGFLIGGITLEDASKNVAGGPQNLRDALTEVVTDVLDEWFVEPPVPPSANTGADPPSAQAATPASKV